jgi:hypothetical protein
LPLFPRLPATSAAQRLGQQHHGVLQLQRQPLQDKQLTITRSSKSLTPPANFVLRKYPQKIPGISFWATLNLDR